MVTYETGVDPSLTFSPSLSRKSREIARSVPPHHFATPLTARDEVMEGIQGGDGRGG